MLEFFYQWMQNLSFYLVLVTAFLHMIPNSTYKKYVRFFTGLILMILLLTPLFELPGQKVKLDEILDTQEFEEKIEKFQLDEEKETGIAVEEIEIGHENMD